MPSLGGSITTMSYFPFTRSIFSKTSPAIKFIFSISFSFALSKAFSTASSIISIPIALFADFANNWVMVPVPEYRSRTFLFLSTFANSIAF